MTTLREEYTKYKEHKNRIVDEASIAWIENNVILVNERIDRKTVNRLTNSIIKFDEEFGPVKEQLPAIQDILDKAEEGLRLVLTGRTSDTRATDMLKQLSFVYNMLSSFFSSDLPVLLRTPIFFSAKSEPDKRIDMITGPERVEDIEKAFEVALRPTKEELKLYGRVYKGIPMPHLKASSIAKQLLGLSYNDLLGLTGVEKVPMVVTQGPPETSKSDYPEPTDMLEEKDELLDEQADPQVIKNASAVVAELAKLQPAIDLFPDDIKNSFNVFRQQAKTVLASGKQREIQWYLEQMGIVLGTFKALGDASKAIEPLFNPEPGKEGESLSQDDVNNLKKILDKALRGGWVQKVKSIFKTQPPKGLEPQTILNSLMSAAQEVSQETLQAGAAAAAADAASQGVTASDQAASQTSAKLKENIQKNYEELLKEMTGEELKKMFGTISQISSAITVPAAPKAGAVPAQLTSKTEPTGTSTPATPTKGSVPSTPTMAPGSGTQTTGETKEVVQDVFKALSVVIPDQAKRKEIMKSLRNSGIKFYK